MPKGLTQSHPLDNPVWSSLTGPHARFALRSGAVLRYHADVSPFVGMPGQPGTADWDDLAALAGPGGLVAMAGERVQPPAGWAVTLAADGVQLINDSATADAGPGTATLSDLADDVRMVRLGSTDVPEMLDLVRRTRPGPFLPRTVELGIYLGIRTRPGRGGALVAMAGERLKPPGSTEISAVCTDEKWRGRGLATRLVQTLVASIRARGQTAFLHATASNTAAIGLYEQLGFRLRRTTVFTAMRVPESR